MSTNAQRLAEEVRARRSQLDLNQIAVWQAGGPSNTTLTEIENGRVDALTPATARKLDKGLRWEPGSARRVWEGGSPTPLPAARYDELEDLRQRILASPALTAEQKAEALAAIATPTAPPEVERGSA